MTNNDELALKMRKVISHGAPGVWLRPIEVEALLAERDADKKRIADLQHQREEETQRANRADFEGYSRAMREMEARTVSVPTFEEWCQMEDMKPLGWVREAMKEAYDGCRAAAGIKLDVGE